MNGEALVHSEVEICAKETLSNFSRKTKVTKAHLTLTFHSLPHLFLPRVLVLLIDYLVHHHLSSSVRMTN